MLLIRDNIPSKLLQYKNPDKEFQNSLLKLNINKKFDSYQGYINCI